MCVTFGSTPQINFVAFVMFLSWSEDVYEVYDTWQQF